MIELAQKLSLWKLTLLVVIALVYISPPKTFAQDNISAKSKEVYDQVKAFALTNGSAEVKSLVLKRDRAEMTFDGTFFFAAPVDGHVPGAVFIGQGTFRADVPPNEFEKDNVRRMLGADLVESDFKTVVMRFSDDTFEQIAKNRTEGGAANERALKLAAEIDPRILKETGANLAARLAVSILNAEKPGFFFANFDGGRRGRFSLLLDHQNRIPVASFSINGGEKGLIFSYQGSLYGNDLWMAFYSLEDYQRRVVEYSDLSDQVDITHYDMGLNLRDYSSKLKLRAAVSMTTRSSNLRALTFQIGEGLGEYDDRRLKKQLRVKAVRSGGTNLSVVQEDWEGGLTVFLPAIAQAAQKLELEFEFEGDFMRDSETVRGASYPSSNTTWYPRHGYLDRSTFDLQFLHKKSLKIASVGSRLSEEPTPEDKDLIVTKYRMPEPVALVVFALGPWERHTEMIKWDKGGDPIPAEFNSLSGAVMPIKEDFILAELNNAVRYFSVLFGKYPYPSFGAAFHPFAFGQGFPSLLMIPPTDRASKYTYVFVAHETAHQWWGNIVAWRSYRDQWLSEGFAEYSGILYTGLRDSKKAREDLLGELRESLKLPPETKTGIGKGRLVDVGPIILGHRLDTSKTYGAYQTLIYNKGALVLRMLHFLLSDPSTGDDKAFFTMMTDFVERHRNSVASTDDFRVVANEHFAKSPIGQKFRLTDLNWFFSQWVYQSGYPSYQMEYRIEDQPDGKVLLSGTITQENVPENWFMPLPVVFSFGNNQEARGTVHALGPKTPFQIKLPMRPKKVELDPNKWVLAEKISTKGN